MRTNADWGPPCAGVYVGLNSDLLASVELFVVVFVGSRRCSSEVSGMLAVVVAVAAGAGLCGI